MCSVQCRSVCILLCGRTIERRGLGQCSVVQPHSQHSDLAAAAGGRLILTGQHCHPNTANSHPSPPSEPSNRWPSLKPTLQPGSAPAMDSDSDRDESVSRRSDALLADDGSAAGYGDGNEQAYGSYGGGSYGSGGGGAAGRGPRGRPRVMQLEDTRADRDVWGDGAAGGGGQGGEAPDRMGFWRGGGMMAQGGRKSHHAHTLSAPALSAAINGGGGGAGAGGAASASSALDAVAAVPPPDKSGQSTHKCSAVCREQRIVVAG